MIKQVLDEVTSSSAFTPRLPTSEGLLIREIYGSTPDGVLAGPHDRYPYRTPLQIRSYLPCFMSVCSPITQGDTRESRVGTPILSDCPGMGANIPRQSAPSTATEHLNPSWGDSRPL